MTFEYTIKPIPTTYAGVNFRSRLEARWAAFFDLACWSWDYEPFDLEGWTPDFLLRTKSGNILVEVKPIELMRPISLSTAAAYRKAVLHHRDHVLLLLGIAPLMDDGDPIGSLLIPEGQARSDFEFVYELQSKELWREAGNKVQWISYHDDIDDRPQDTRAIIDRAMAKARMAAKAAA